MHKASTLTTEVGHTHIHIQHNCT